MDKRWAGIASNFAIKECGANSLTAEGLIDLRWTDFEGHFPNNPLLPAVSILEFSMYLARANKLTKGTLIKIGHTKFLEPIRPQYNVQIILKSENGQTCSGEWRCLINDEWKKCAQFEMEFK